MRTYQRKQKLRRIIAFALTVCMLFVMLPPGKARAEDTEVIPQTYVDDSFDVNAIPAYEPEGDSKILTYVHPEVFAQGDHIYRLKQDETLSSYAFLNRDGTKTVYYLDEAVKFTAADGSIREKDLTLTAAMKGYQTAENDIGLHISENPAAGIRIAYNNKQITLLPNGGSGAGQLSGNTVRYEGYYGEDTALVYTPTLNGVKEEIILSSYTGQNEFVFYINTGGLYLYQTGDRYYLAEGKGSTYRIWLGQIEVFDRNLKPCKGEMTAETILAGQRYKLTVSVSEAYLTDPETVYPVTVDPTLTVSDNTYGAGAIQDAPIYEGYPTSNFGSYQYNRAGYAGTAYKKGRTAVKLSGLLSDSGYMNAVAGEITSAQFYMADASGTSNVNVVLRALDSNSTWTENTVTWNNVGSTASTPYANVAPPAGGFGCFDITDLVKAWKNGSYSSGQCGFLLRGNNEVSTDKVLYSCEHSTSAMWPYVTVTYSTGSRTVNITNTVISVNENSTKDLTATTSPSGLTVTWTSSNPSVATVNSSGMVTGVNSGTATITASVPGGGTAACAVYVVKAAGVYRMRNVASDYYLDGGGANIHPDNLTNITQKTRNNNTLTPDYLSQWWKIKYLSNGLYSIRPMHKLDMGLHGTTSDVSLQQIGTTDTEAGVTASARWSISYNSNGFVLKSNNDPLKTLSPLLGATTANATIAAVSYSASSTAQRWTLSKLTAPHKKIIFYHSISGKPIDDLEVHIAEGQTKGFGDWFVIPAVVSDETCSQELTITIPPGSDISRNASGQFVVDVQQGTAERTVTITVTGAGSNGPSDTFQLKVLDESKILYLDHYYISGWFSQAQFAYIPNAVAFADHVLGSYGFSLQTSGAPAAHTGISEFVNSCESEDGEKNPAPCSEKECGEICSEHHKNVDNLRHRLLNNTAREQNHISVLWSDFEAGFCCVSENGISTEHTECNWVAQSSQGMPIVHIIYLLGNTQAEKEACAAINLLHEIAHSLGMPEMYEIAGHDQENDICIMEHIKTDAGEYPQFYADVFRGADTAFCQSCVNQMNLLAAAFEGFEAYEPL